MESSSTATADGEGQPLSSSPRSRALQSLLPSVNVTRLPASVTNLLACVSHEIEIIENELNQCYESQGDNSDSKDCSFERMELLEDAIDDGFMCVDLRVIERKLEVWHRLFSPSLKVQQQQQLETKDLEQTQQRLEYTVTPFFAVKCNPDPVVVEWLARSAMHNNLPLGFDCASIAELELAKKNIEKYKLGKRKTSSGDCHQQTCGNETTIPTTRIVYANPQRAEADLMKALELFATPESEETSSDENSLTNDLWLTLDGVEEVYKIAIARERFLKKHNSENQQQRQQQSTAAIPLLVMPRIRIILRIWVPDGHSQVPLGEKFGMQLDQIDAIVDTCLEHGIDSRDIIGVSFHCGSGCESVETYLEALDMGRGALEAIDKKLSSSFDRPHRCWLLDIGGGFPGLDGLYGDKGRFAALGNLVSPQNTIEEKKEGDQQHKMLAPLQQLPTQSQTTTVADIAVAVQPVLQSLAKGESKNCAAASEKDEQTDQRGAHPPLTLIAEPGRYFVEGAFALASRIYQKQILPQSQATLPTTLTTHTNTNQQTDVSNESIRVYRIPHGVQGVFKDVLLCGESFVPQPLQIQSPEGSDQRVLVPPREVSSDRPLYPSRVLGPSGDDSEDVVCESCWLPELAIGDWLVFDRMGAYTLSIASRAGRPVMRYVMGGGGEKESKPEYN